MPEETAFALTEEAGILTLTMSAPGNNLMTGAFFREYEAIMDQVQLRSTQPGIRGLIIRGGGRHFSVGADVDALAERSAAESFDGKRLPPAHCKQKRHFTFLRSLPFPVVSVVTGFCIGSGSEIAVNCHYRICDKNARVGQPESTFGILPALGGLARTIKLCGMSNAYRLVMSGELIPAETAYALGWADFLCGKKQGYAQAVALIDWISSHRAHFSDEDSLPLLRQYLQEGAEL